MPIVRTTDERVSTCAGCGAAMVHENGETYLFVCAECALRYPNSLIKACVDEFSYALRLRSGDIIRFAFAEIHGEFVTVSSPFGTERGNVFPFPRGVDVRISDIVWCADDPEAPNS